MLALRGVHDGGIVQCDASAQMNPMTKLTNKPDVEKLDEAIINDKSAPMRKRMETYVKLLQLRLVEAVEAEEAACDGSRVPPEFLVESWARKEGGEGISCVLQDGAAFEKAGINVSVVYGQLPPAAIRQMSADHGGLTERVGYKTEGADAEVVSLPFFATGISVVMHARNPFVPTVHMNYRYFELNHPEKLKDGSSNPRYSTEPVAWWFGGGTDLTPVYLFPEDARHFHRMLKEAADAHDPAFYPAWKKWCDKYFWIPHRKEARGIGGIFFDDLTIPRWASTPRSFLPLFDGTPSESVQLVSSSPHERESLFQTVQALGNAFVPAYMPIVQARKKTPFDAHNVDWKHLRRGRYVEFNLIYDRGTKFGLMTPGARIESILMSLPLEARWEYMDSSAGTGREQSSVATRSRDEKMRKHAEEMAARDTLQTILEHPIDWA
ncbi:coproporphyrinogen oxidase [Malassezia sp. CBS 17886]|nr:coproporphyrinogen oxidase [Malassezia sp. CBS 17886]